LPPQGIGQRDGEKGGDINEILVEILYPMKDMTSIRKVTKNADVICKEH
jgi:hypothetical protein